LAALITAAACVFHRYHHELVTLGLLDHSREVRVLCLAVDPGDNAPDIAKIVARALHDGKLKAAPITDHDTAINPQFAALLGFGVPVAEFPQRRQDINLSLDRPAHQLACSYNSKIFDQRSVANFLQHVHTFLVQALSIKAGPIGELSYLTDAELRTQEAFFAPDVAGPTPKETLQSMFQRVAATHPQSVAVETETTFTTYAELDDMASRVAAGLQNRGFDAGAVVALAARPGLEQIAGVLGILKARMTPLPLDYTFPARRLHSILSIGKPALILSDGSLAGRLPAEFPELELAAALCADHDAKTQHAGNLDDAAYLLFTSGSTGIPKGVAMAQRSIVNLVLWQAACSGEDGRRTLNRSSIGFDVSYQEIFSTLCFGQTLVVASDSQRADITDLTAFIAQRRVSRIFVPPVALVQIASSLSSLAQDLQELRHVIVAGETMRITPAIIRMFRKIPARVTNQYGPTETHVATSYDLNGSPLKWPQLPPIGRPIANARVYVVDAGLQLCPVGVPGEIAIGGVLPAIEYVGAEPEAKRSFTANPFVEDGTAPARVYLTGDIGRFGWDGNLEFLGRTDDQIKLRGYRIELGDLAANATRIDGVKYAAATLQERTATGPFLCLFIEPEPGAKLTPRSIRENLLSSLPGHMVPGLSAISIVEQLPLNVNGKVDVKALPALAVEHAGYEPGEGLSLEEETAAIWRAHLGLSSLPQGGDFVSLGGHSLLAISMVSQLNERFGVSVPVRILLQGASCESLVQYIRGQLDQRPCASSAEPDGHQLLSRLAEVALASGATILAPYPNEAKHYDFEVNTRNVYFRKTRFRPNDAAVVVDCGANVGVFSLALLQTLPHSRLIAIEPAPLPFEALQRNLAPYSNRVTLLNKGAWDVEGEREFVMYEGVTGMSSFDADLESDRALFGRLLKNTASLDAPAELRERYVASQLAASTVARQVTRLSQVFSECGLSHIDLLKIDVHRGTMPVLKGVNASDWSRIRNVVVEHHGNRNEISAVEMFLGSAGFAVTTVQDDMHSDTSVVYSYGAKQFG
jgi:amino acid adenylation domain-containing protein/FkbM family methyltransferase